MASGSASSSPAAIARADGDVVAAAGPRDWDEPPHRRVGAPVAQRICRADALGGQTVCVHTCPGLTPVIVR